MKKKKQKAININYIIAYWDRGQTEAGLVAFYDIRPGNAAGLLSDAWSWHGTTETEGS